MVAAVGVEVVLAEAVSAVAAVEGSVVLAEAGLVVEEQAEAGDAEGAVGEVRRKQWKRSSLSSSSG